MDDENIIDVEESIEVEEDNEEILKQREDEMLNKIGSIIYYDGELADISKLQVVNKVYSLVNINRNTPVLYEGSIMKIQGLIAALSVKNVLEAVYKQEFCVVEYDAIQNKEGIIF